MGNLIKSKQVKTRKEHNCFGCGRTFPKGSKLESATHRTYDGCIETNYWCNVCLEYWNRYMQDGDEILMGELRTNDQEGWEEVRNDVVDS